MNYFLIIVILGVCGGAYYEHNLDEQEITNLQRQVAELSARHLPPASPAVSPTGGAGVSAPTANATGGVSNGPVTQGAGAVLPAAVLPADTSHSSAIDTAANAAMTAESSDSMGTITTLDGRTFTDCKILKVEADGITFSHADGITKVLFPLLSPEVQKKFGYDPQKAAAATAAQINYQQAARTVPSSNAASNP